MGFSSALTLEILLIVIGFTFVMDQTVIFSGLVRALVQTFAQLNVELWICTSTPLVSAS